MLTRREIEKKLNRPIEELKIGFTASSFDLGPHIGHCLMLQEARENCDYLIVAIMTNPQNDRPEKNKPVQSIFERMIQVQSIRYVDEVIFIDSEDDLENAIKIIKPDIRFVGEEYRDIEHTGKGICKIYYNKRDHNYSSDKLRKNLMHQMLKDGFGKLLKVEEK